MRFLAVILLLVLAGCPEQAKPGLEPTVIATVNGAVVSRTDFERELSRELQALEAEHVSEQQLRVQARRRDTAAIGTEISPPQIVPSVPKPVPSKMTPMAGSCC